MDRERCTPTRLCSGCRATYMHSIALLVPQIDDGVVYIAASLLANLSEAERTATGATFKPVPFFPAKMYCGFIQTRQVAGHQGFLSWGEFSAYANAGEMWVGTMERFFEQTRVVKPTEERVMN